MGSSGGGGDGGMGMMALMGQGKPMPGLPIAGQGPGTDAFKYGQFQNFLPEPKAEGQNDMATGLRPDMFKYRSPGGAAAEGAGGSGSDDVAGQIQGLRDELAALQAGGGGGGAVSGDPFTQEGIAMQNMTRGGIGTMGMGRGGVGTMGLGGGVPGIIGGPWTTDLGSGGSGPAGPGDAPRGGPRPPGSNPGSPLVSYGVGPPAVMYRGPGR